MPSKLYNILLPKVTGKNKCAYGSKYGENTKKKSYKSSVNPFKCATFITSEYVYIHSVKLMEVEFPWDVLRDELFEC